jgi:hypothetical protein
MVRYEKSPKIWQEFLFCHPDKNWLRRILFPKYELKCTRKTTEGTVPNRPAPPITNSDDDVLPAQESSHFGGEPQSRG